MKPRIDIPGERATIHRKLAKVWEPVLHAWKEGGGTLAVRQREHDAKQESRGLRRRLSRLKELERRRVYRPEGT